MRDKIKALAVYIDREHSITRRDSGGVAIHPPVYCWFDPELIFHQQMFVEEPIFEIVKGPKNVQVHIVGDGNFVLKLS